jgi:hypothetical protein
MQWCGALRSNGTFLTNYREHFVDGMQPVVRMIRTKQPFAHSKAGESQVSSVLAVLYGQRLTASREEDFQSFDEAITTGVEVVANSRRRDWRDPRASDSEN